MNTVTAPAARVRGTEDYVAARSDVARQLSTIAQTALPVAGAQGDLFGMCDDPARADAPACGDCGADAGQVCDPTCPSWASDVDGLF